MKGRFCRFAGMTLLCLVSNLLVFIFAADSLYIEIADKVDIVVAADGSGDYTTVQGAINAIPSNNSSEKVIYIRNGIYKEKIVAPSYKPFITLIGEHVDSTVLTYDDYSGRIVNDVEIGTSTSYSFAADGNNFKAMNITFENSAGNVGQAVALRTNADRQIFLHCKMVGYQDTYYTWGRYRNYLKDCKIIGATDYIFGATTAIFDSCQIHSLKAGSYITAASTEEWASFGYVFFNCRLTADYKKTGIYLGRPWKPYANTVFYECELGDFVHQRGWSAWSGNSNDSTCFYAEYNCFGPGSDTINRVDWSHQLTDAEAEEYTVANIFSKSSNPTNFSNDWLPVVENNDLYRAVMKHTVSFLDSSNFNARLAEIRYEGTILDDFSPDKYNYYIELPDGITEIPAIEVKTEEPGATYSINYPANLPGTATVMVTAADEGTFVNYAVLFSVDSAFANAFLESLKYWSNSVPDFDPYVFNYTVELPYGTTNIPNIYAATEIDAATVEIIKPDELPGQGVIIVTSADGMTQNMYTIDFTIAPSTIHRDKSNERYAISNPFSSTLSLRFSSIPVQEAELSLYSLHGNLVMCRKFSPASSHNINLGWLDAGFYIYQLNVDGKIFSGKIVKSD